MEMLAWNCIIKKSEKFHTKVIEFSSDKKSEVQPRGGLVADDTVGILLQAKYKTNQVLITLDSIFLFFLPPQVWKGDRKKIRNS